MLKTDLFWPQRCEEPVDAYRDKERDRDREKKRGSLQRKTKEDIKKIGELKITFVTENKGDGGCGVDRMVFFLFFVFFFLVAVGTI